jgi:hypothetical protein
VLQNKGIDAMQIWIRLVSGQFRKRTAGVVEFTQLFACLLVSQQQT